MNEDIPIMIAQLDAAPTPAARARLVADLPLGVFCRHEAEILEIVKRHDDQRYLLKFIGIVEALLNAPGEHSASSWLTYATARTALKGIAKELEGTT